MSNNVRFFFAIRPDVFRVFVKTFYILWQKLFELFNINEKNTHTMQYKTSFGCKSIITSFTGIPTPLRKLTLNCSC